MAAPVKQVGTARHLGSGRISAMLSGKALTSGNRQLQLLDTKGKPLGDPVHAMVRAEGDFARLRARVDPRLAPGRYRAALTGGDEAGPIEIVVDPVVALRVDPPVLKIEGTPGGKRAVDVTIANSGNVPAELPRVGAFGVFRKNGLEDAFGKAYRSNASDGRQLFERFVEGLRSNYGGLVRVKVDYEGPIPPGEVRAVHLTIELPDALQEDGRYSGIWPLLNLNYSVQIAVTGGSGPRKRGGKA